MCSEPGCSEPVYALGLCRPHYDRQRYLKGKNSVRTNEDFRTEKLAEAYMLLRDAHKFILYVQNDPPVSRLLDEDKVAKLGERVDNFLRSFE